MSDCVIEQAVHHEIEVARIDLRWTGGLRMHWDAGSSNEIYYTNGTVYYVASPQEARPATPSGVTHIRLDRDYVTVQTHDGTHIIPRDRFIQSSPNSSGAPSTTQ